MVNTRFDDLLTVGVRLNFWIIDGACLAGAWADVVIPIAPRWVDKQLGWVGGEPGGVHFGRISTSSP